MPMPAAKPIAVGDDADGERLGGDGNDDLAPRRTDGPHQCRLACALGDEDRERVVDAEGGDDDGDAGEGEQHGLEEAEEVTLDVARCSAVSSAPVSASMPSGSSALIRASRCVGGDSARSARTRTPVSESDAAGEQLLGGVGVEGEVRDPADVVGLAVRGQSDDRDRDRLGREHGRSRRRRQGRRARRSLGRSTTSPLADAGAPVGQREPAELWVGDPVGGDGGGSIAADRVWPSAPINVGRCRGPRATQTRRRRRRRRRQPSTRRSARACGSPRCRSGSRCGRRRRFRRWPQ